MMASEVEAKAAFWGDFTITHGEDRAAADLSGASHSASP